MAPCFNLGKPLRSLVRIPSCRSDESEGGKSVCINISQINSFSLDQNVLFAPFQFNHSVQHHPQIENRHVRRHGLTNSNPNNRHLTERHRKIKRLLEQVNGESESEERCKKMKKCDNRIRICPKALAAWKETFKKKEEKEEMCKLNPDVCKSRLSITAKKMVSSKEQDCKAQANEANGLEERHTTLESF